MDKPSVRVLDLGTVAYDRAVEIQEELVEQRLEGSAPDTLLLLEHLPVITMGRRASLEDVYLSEGALASQGIALHRSTRGGLVTYHGPGQLVGYPILKLRALGLTVPEYVHRLERALITALSDVRVRAYAHPDHVGVWTDRGKIAAIGIAQRHGVTLHGFGLNVQPNLAHFALINPCGIGNLGVTSVAELLGRSVDLAAMKGLVAAHFAEQLGMSLMGVEHTPTSCGYSIFSTVPSGPR